MAPDGPVSFSDSELLLAQALPGGRSYLPCAQLSLSGTRHLLTGPGLPSQLSEEAGRLSACCRPLTARPLILWNVENPGPCGVTLDHKLKC